MPEVLSDSSLDRVITGGDAIETDPNEATGPTDERPASTLIEFPGATRTIPEWRKQLSQRVREVQERRAREAAEAAAAAQEAESVSVALPSAQLELVPDLEQPAMNPIVSKALERVDRARRGDFVGAGFAATAAAPAPVSDDLPEPLQPASEIGATKHKLVVVSPGKPASKVRKPVRLIADGAEDAALSYLETYLSVPTIAPDPSDHHATFSRRIVAAVLDLLLMALLAAPFAAAIEFADGNWSDPRTIGLMSGIAIVVMFTYLTISIALTGRTAGMRLLSLRAIDARTGLIPTGGQSAKRALGFLLSLVSLGLGMIYALIDRDGRALHDRFSKTVVVHD
ncbi:MAG TPA: RDD family protein [Pyrinomonadaceae bacterium]|nr:RDD family protein [Pyrinomonadaceae bacterium]